MIDTTCDLMPLTQLFEFSDDQINVIKELNNFFNNDDEHIFILSGYAGTGKTFLTANIACYLKIFSQFAVKIVAPTGKASNNLRTKLEQCANSFKLHNNLNNIGIDCLTIFAAIYGYNSFNDLTLLVDKQEDNLYKLFFNLKANELDSNQIWFVDEASLIGNYYQDNEFISFGSGYLLDDMIKFFDFDRLRKTIKVVFIGDRAQLPPINMTFSPAMSKKYIEERYLLKVREACLSTVVRQSQDSMILKNSMVLRKNIIEHNYSQLNFNFDKSFKQLDEISLINGYLNAFYQDKNSIILVAQSNNECIKFNHQIRKIIYNKEATKPLNIGDKLIIDRNSFIYNLTNGEIVYVEKIIANIETIEVITNYNKKLIENNINNQVYCPIGNNKYAVYLQYIDVCLRKSNDELVYCKLLLNKLVCTQRDLSRIEYIAQYVDFLKRNNISKIKHDKEAIRDCFLSDPYYNAIHARYGHAITCHKAQGSEWKYVLIKLKSIRKINETYLRWLYTAITRGKTALALCNFNNITPWSYKQQNIMPFTFNNIDNSSNLDEIYDTSKTNNSLANTKDISSLITAADNNTNTSDLNTKIKAIIAQYNYMIINIEHLNYLERFHLRNLNSTHNCRLDLFYNGKNILTKVNCSDLSTQEINHIVIDINNLIGTSFSQNVNNNIDLSKLNNCCSKYLSFMHDKFKALNISIENIESFEWFIRVHFKQNQAKAAFKIYYNAHDQITKIMPEFKYCKDSMLTACLNNLFNNN